MIGLQVEYITRMALCCTRGCECTVSVPPHIGPIHVCYWCQYQPQGTEWQIGTTQLQGSGRTHRAEFVLISYGSARYIASPIHTCTVWACSWHVAETSIVNRILADQFLIELESHHSFTTPFLFFLLSNILTQNASANLITVILLEVEVERHSADGCWIKTHGWISQVASWNKEWIETLQ